MKIADGAGSFGNNAVAVGPWRRRPCPPTESFLRVAKLAVEDGAS
jgi:hypothetical protein